MHYSPLLLKYLWCQWKKLQTFSRQCRSPRDQGLDLEAPRGHKLKSWSWSRVMGLGLGLKGLGLVTKVSVIFKTFQCLYSTVFAATIVL